MVLVGAFVVPLLVQNSTSASTSHSTCSDSSCSVTSAHRPQATQGSILSHQILQSSFQSIPTPKIYEFCFIAISTAVLES